MAKTSSNIGGAPKVRHRAHNGLILASNSSIRADILRHAGLKFTIAVSNVDEEAIKSEYWRQLTPKQSPKQNKEQSEEKIGALAIRLAGEKAKAVGAKLDTDFFIIGADQILLCDGRLFDKAKTMAEMRDKLEFLRGRTHYLTSGVVLAKGKDVIWHHIGTAHLTMREFSDQFLEDYLKKAQENLLQCVGGYQLENLGAQLFSKIDGDYFTILGLPLLPLLDALRHHTHGIILR